MHNGVPVVHDTQGPRDHAASAGDASLKPATMLREQALTRDSLFHAIDERRCKGWFVRIEVPGMHARRVGPFTTQQKALDCYEEFLDGVMQAFVNFKMRWRTPRPMWWKGFRG